MKPLLLFGFKKERFLQWKDVLNDAGRTDSILKLLAQMLLVAISGLPHLNENRRLWRAKLRVCMRCPIYLKSMKRCGVHHSINAGCFCFMPFKALFVPVKKGKRRGCWGDQHIEDFEFGWIRNVK